MKSLLTFCAFILVITSGLKAEVIKVHSFDQNYSINITEEFCFDPEHPVSKERERMLATVKKPLAVFLKCSDKYSGTEGWVSRYSKPVSGDNASIQISINNDFLSGSSLPKNSEQFDELASKFPDNEYLNTLNKKLRDGLSMNDWSADERKIVSIDRSHIIHATKGTIILDNKENTAIVMTCITTKAPTILFINIRFRATQMDDGLILYYADLLKAISQSIELLD